MNTITLWLLVTSLASGYYARQPVVIERFVTQQDCASAADRLLGSREKNGMPSMSAACIEVKAYKP